MCLKPLKINNPAKRFDLKGGQPLILEVPCGRCAECKKNKRLEWYFRAYHQCQDTINTGGYVYFDTLTYSDDNVPHLSDFVDLAQIKDCADFMCFNHVHWRNFLKNMRRQIHFHYKGCSFKYFLTSEYGTDERFTHRPHYHILFFIKGPIHPFDFSKLVSKCWNYGRTDGLPYKSNSYTAEHVYGYNLGFPQDGTPFEICTKVCNYVSKYVTKDSKFQNEIDNRIELLKKHIDNEDELKDIIRSVDMFHRCSQGFGLGYLRQLDADEYNFIYQNGACRIGDKARIKYVIKLPLYFKRKLFYKVLKREDNTLYWQLNDVGIDYQKRYLLSCVDKLSANYRLLLSLTNDDEYSSIKKLFGDRTIEDFVTYKLFYKNRLRDVYTDFGYKTFNTRCQLNDKEDNLYDWLNSIIDSSFANSKDNHSIVDCDADTHNIVLSLSFGDLFHNNIETLNVNKNDFIRQFRFNEHSCFAFRHFDKIDSLFKLLKEPSNESKQRTFDFIEELTQKFKVLYYE